MSGKGFALRVTAANLSSFEPLLRTSKTSGKSGSQDPSVVDIDEANTSLSPARKKAEALFQGRRFQIKSPFKRTRAVKRGSPSYVPKSDIAAGGAASRGKLLWRTASVPASSVQRQTGNPTGGLRLVKARFTIGGKQIDQTTYFRDIAFGSLTWTVGRKKPRREDTKANFRVTLMGVSYGILPLAISHKPSGEAGQNNYTTILHWSELATLLRTKLNLTGKTVEIYAPAGTGEPFSLVVS